MKTMTELTEARAAETSEESSCGSVQNLWPLNAEVDSGEVWCKLQRMWCKMQRSYYGARIISREVTTRLAFTFGWDVIRPYSRLGRI